MQHIMKSTLPVFLVLFIPALAIELYTYSGLKPYIVQFDQTNFYWFLYYFQILLTLISLIIFTKSVVQQHSGSLRKVYLNIFSGLALTLLLTKLAFVSVMFTEDIFRVGQSLFAYLIDGEADLKVLGRNNYFAFVGLGVASIPLVTFLHGITIGKYKFTVKRIKLEFDDLPEKFDGYKILQFSDMHSGSFDSLSRVKKGIEKMKQEQADIILFTGDMVNNLADEVKPFVPMLKELKAKDGKYSILGNHDYGDYIRWANKEDKIENLYKLINYQHESGFQLLLNENISVERDGEFIHIVGVENWGKPPFPQHGDLNGSLSSLSEKDFTILMSHDPSHWDLEVIKHKKKVHLTLSGHTHGMQMGLDIPGLKWSPVKYKYPRWSGLYEEAGRYLYVNNGFGFLGFPGRVGIYPEITIIELCKRGKS